MMPCLQCGLQKDTGSVVFDALSLCMVYPELAVQLCLLVPPVQTSGPCPFVCLFSVFILCVSTFPTHLGVSDIFLFLDFDILSFPLSTL